MRAALLAVAMLSAAAARAQTFPSSALGGSPFGALDPSALTPPPAVTGTPLPGQLVPEEKKTNFSYGEINNKLKKIIIGRPLEFKGDIRVADRVDRGEIKWIVIHSAMGSCKSAINTMEVQHEASAHFIVCKDGSVTRLVDIKNISLHVKNEQINDASVGIETETGETVRRNGKLVGDYRQDDWDPASHWKMYSSLAWLIRALSEETHVPRVWTDDHTYGIIGHREADKRHVDAQGRHDGHTDPGVDFYTKNFHSLDERFPGESMTPQRYLMLLVNEDEPPSITLDDGLAPRLRVEDSARAGLAKVELFAPGSSPLAPAMRSWKAPEAGLPRADVELAIPTAAGVYLIEAYDLVGNLTAARLTVGGEGRASSLSVEP